MPPSHAQVATDTQLYAFDTVTGASTSRLTRLKVAGCFLHDVSHGRVHMTNHFDLKQSFASALIQYDEAQDIPRSHSDLEQLLRRSLDL